MKTIEDVKKDYHHFIDIQMEKYFKLTGKKSFESEQEAKLVLDEIVICYNDKVASERLKLDNLNPIAKKNWFKSIEINYSKIISNQDDSFKDFDISIEEVSKNFNNIFDYLPKDSISVFIFCSPALEAFGMPFNRFQEIVEGAEQAEIEKEAIDWAFEVTVFTMDSALARSKTKKKKSYAMAVEAARDFLELEQAEAVVKNIYNNIAEDLEIPTKDLMPDKIIKKSETYS